MLPFPVFVTSPSSLSVRLDQFAPVSSPFSVPSANSAFKSPHNPASQSSESARQPTHFPLFPHLVNIAHAGTPANPFRSIVYFITCGHPPVGGPCSPLISSGSPAKRCPTSVTPLDAILTKNTGEAPPFARSGFFRLVTSLRPLRLYLNFATLCLRGTP
jgi:hypothetical protein